MVTARLLACRIAVRGEMRRAGVKFSRINKAIQNLDDEMVEYAANKSGVTEAMPVEDEEDEDPEDQPGPIRRFLKWLFTSPEGRAFLSLLIQLLIGALEPEEIPVGEKKTGFQGILHSAPGDRLT